MNRELLTRDDTRKCWFVYVYSPRPLFVSFRAAAAKNPGSPFTSPLDLRLWITRAHPRDELFRHWHRRQATLPHQRPVVELLRLLDLRQRDRRFDPSRVLQLDHRRLRILRIVARRRFHRRHSDHARNTAAVIDKYNVARLHLANSANRLRIGHAVPCCALVAFEVIDRISPRFSLG